MQYSALSAVGRSRNHSKHITPTCRGDTWTIQRSLTGDMLSKPPGVLGQYINV